MAYFFVEIYENFSGMRFISQSVFGGHLIMEKLSRKKKYENQICTQMYRQKTRS